MGAGRGARWTAGGLDIGGHLAADAVFIIITVIDDLDDYLSRLEAGCTLRAAHVVLGLLAGTTSGF